MKIVVSPTLREEHIRALIRGDILAVRISEYCSEKESHRLSELAINHQNPINYKHDVVGPDGRIEERDYRVQTPAIPFTWVLTHTDNPNIFSEYLKSTRRQKKLIERALNEQPSPVDRLMQDFEQAWPHGSEVATHQDTRIFPGLLRVTLANAKRLQEEPHIDSIQVPFNQAGQLSANIYLVVPEAGGELMVWDTAPLSANDAKIFETGGNIKEILATSDCYLLKPQKGDLIIINTRIPHAVTTFNIGNRVTQQTFIGLEHPGGPMLFWS